MRSNKSNYRLNILLLVTLQLLFSNCQAAYFIEVPPVAEECFFTRSPKSEAVLFGNFELLESDVSADPLSVLISDNRNSRTLWRSRRGVRESSFKISLDEDQKVSICIANGVSSGGGRKTNRNQIEDGATRTVGLQFTVEERNRVLELQNKNSKLITAALDLTRKLDDLQTHHVNARTREAMHRAVVEKTFSQLLNWAILESLAVIFVAGGQIMYFRRFLEQRRYI